MTGTGTMQELAAPLGSVSEGHLLFTRGASHLTIGVDGSMEDLYRARFDAKLPDIHAEEGTVTVRYRTSLHPPRGEITLSGRVPWDIKARWGMSHVEADLRDLGLRGLEISGGSSHIEMRLPRPSQAVGIRIGGGASDVELIRPAGVPVRIRIGSGTSKLAVDEFRLDSAGGKTEWQSPDFDVVAGRYDVEIGAGASKVTIRT
jgi:hypothetical protein